LAPDQIKLLAEDKIGYLGESQVNEIDAKNVHLLQDHQLPWLSDPLLIDALTQQNPEKIRHLSPEGHKLLQQPKAILQAIHPEKLTQQQRDIIQQHFATLTSAEAIDDLPIAYLTLLAPGQIKLLAEDKIGYLGQSQVNEIDAKNVHLLQDHQLPWLSNPLLIDALSQQNPEKIRHLSPEGHKLLQQPEAILQAIHPEKLTQQQRDIIQQHFATLTSAEAIDDLPIAYLTLLAPGQIKLLAEDKIAHLTQKQWQWLGNNQVRAFFDTPKQVDPTFINGLNIRTWMSLPKEQAQYLSIGKRCILFFMQLVLSLTRAIGSMFYFLFPKNRSLSK